MTKKNPINNKSTESELLTMRHIFQILLMAFAVKTGMCILILPYINEALFPSLITTPLTLSTLHCFSHLLVLGSHAQLLYSFFSGLPTLINSISFDYI